ncbi:hypothetical protein PInf_018273 [Phytophthora infestans]|nr:hypothetical protein PInf_018273 [Phytophthora infestans]
MHSMIHYTGLVALLLSGVSAHGYLGLPAVTFPNDVDKTQFIATIEASASGFSGSFSGSPSANTETFWTAFSSSKFTSIKEFVTALGQVVATGANLQCGLTDPNETPQPLPEQIEWTHSDTEGFTSSHEGPCEAWCDDTQVFQDTNCAAHFTTAPAKLPYNKAACSGASRLAFYWLALHSSTWQVYANCAALEGAGGSYAPSHANSSESTGQPDTPTVTTAAPTVTTAVATSAPLVSGSTVADNEDEEDCGSLDVAGSDDNPVGGDADTAEEDCGSLDVAGSEDDCGSLDVAGNEEDEDCGSLDVAEPEATTLSESSLNFDSVGGGYISGKVQPQWQS